MRKLIWFIMPIVFIMAIFIKVHFVKSRTVAQAVTFSGEFKVNGKPVALAKADNGNFTLEQKLSGKINGDLTLISNIVPAVRKEIRVGQRFTLNDQTGGVIISISQSPDQVTGLYNVLLQLDKKPSIATGEIAVGTVKVDKLNAVNIPLSAVLESSDGPYCWVHQNATVTKRFIKTGSRNEEFIQVLSGLKKDDEIVTHGKQLITENDRVRPYAVSGVEK